MFLLIAVIGFHERSGPQLEYHYPKLPDTGTLHGIDCVELYHYLNETLPFIALPDRQEEYNKNDLIKDDDESSTIWKNSCEETSFFFNASVTSNTLNGVSCFRQVNVDMVEDQTLYHDIKRGKIQKSIIILTDLPFQAWLEIRLRAVASELLIKIDEKKIIEFFDSIQSTNFDRFDVFQLFLDLPLLPTIQSLGRDLMAVIRLILLEGRVLFYSCHPNIVSSSILSICSLIPGILLKNFTSSGFQVKQYRYVQYGMPLKIFYDKCFLQPYLVAQNADELFSYSGFLAGTCNSMLPRLPNSYLDCLVDLDSHEVILYDTLKSKVSMNIPSELFLFTERLIQKVNKNIFLINKNKMTLWDGSVDWIRAQFQEHFESLLTTAATCVITKEPEDDSFFLWKVATYLNDSFFLDSSKEEIDANYGLDWFQEWQKTQNFKDWKIKHRIKQIKDHPHPPIEAKNVIYIYENGDRYEGDFSKGLPHGFGIYIEQSTGNKYEGDFRKGIRDGKGILSCCSNGFVYEGDWKDNKRTGNGRCHSRTGESYDGNWLENRFHGLGKHIDFQGNEYEGEWQYGFKSGVGTEWIKTINERYKGEFKDGKRHGSGIATFAGGSCYSGCWIESKQSGEGTCHYINNKVYEGQWLNGKPHGYGILTTSNGDIKEGEMVNGEPKDGKWTITYRNGDQYTGDCKNGRPWGIGILKTNNGDVYSGNFIDGLREGSGISVFANGDHFEGLWMNNAPLSALSTAVIYREVLLNDMELKSALSPSSKKKKEEEEEKDIELIPPESGEHKYIYKPSEDIYIGMFKNHLRHGKGKYIERSTGNQYTGNWLNDLREGNGILISGSKDFIYDGMWKNDCRHGSGHCILSNRETYSGEWKENRFHGNGKYVDSDGSIYEGEWFLGKKEGVGKLTLINGEIYNGEWKGGRRNGIGSCIYSNGETYSGSWFNDERCGDGVLTNEILEYHYEGQWISNMRHGIGIYKEKDGIIREGQWYLDKPNPLESNWTITYPNGSVFTGICKLGIPFGYGICKYENGDVYSGNWLNGLRHGNGICIFKKGETFEGEWKEGHIAVNGKGKLILADGTIHEYKS